MSTISGSEPPRKKMRKGTHSCWECRRRKIRCIFTADNSAVCTECFARGSRCVDQEHAESDVVVDQRKNLRERVARLESLVDTLLEDRTDRGAAEALRDLRTSKLPVTPASTSESPLGPGKEEVPGHIDQAPVLALFNNDVISLGRHTITEDGSNAQLGSPPLISHQHYEGLPTLPELAPVNPALKQKHERSRQALLSVVPPYEKLMPALTKCTSWWDFFRQKCPGTVGRGVKIEDFAARVYHNGKPAELGVLVVAVGVCLANDDLDRYLAVVDKEVIADDEYMGTLEGLECALLVAKSYGDIGQPRRGWLSIRRGLTFAQLIGLHKTHMLSEVRTNLFWTYFQFDRFMSLMLGLPYGIPDSHVVMEFGGESIDTARSSVAFTIKVCRIAGKIIDRTQGPADYSFSSTLEMDQELDALAAEMPPEWWNVPERPKSTDAFIGHMWQEQVLQQIAFHQMRIYLHMPFMLKSAMNPRFEYSRTACFDGARELLRLYHSLRGEGRPLYECKAIDFIGFTAALLLLLGILGYGRLSQTQDPQQEENDWALIDTSTQILRNASREKGGKVAAESLRVLEQLSAVRNKTMSGPGDAECDATKIAIPYFGTISVRRGNRFNHVASRSTSTTQNTPLLTPNTQMTPPLSNTSTDPTTSGYNSSVTDSLIAYDGMYMPSYGLPQMNDDANGSYFGGNFGYPGVQSMPGLDIDQDWNWFLGETAVN